MRIAESDVTMGNVGAYTNLVDIARKSEAKSFLDYPVIILHTLFGLCFAPLVILQLVTTSLLGCAVSITFGLLLFVIDIIWWPFLGFLLASSWLWNHIPIARIILFLPGVFIAEFAQAFVGLMPSMGEWESRGRKIAICGSWPHSIFVLKYKNT